MKNLLIFLTIAPTILIGQSNQDAIVTKDTVGINEVEWIDYYTLYKKENNKPFTGVVKFEGELNYRNNKKGRFLTNSNYLSAVTFISGKVNGLYTVWGKKNGQKKSEITLSHGYAGKITGNGPYAHWFTNGQIGVKGILRDGKKSGKITTWHKNGQLKTEAKYYSGSPEGKFIIWDENGQKSYERYYFNRRVIRTIERDKNGKIVKEWPEVDKDTYGLKIFLNEILSILKSKKYDALEKLFASKEDFINIDFGDKDEILSSDVKKLIIEKWSTLLSVSIDEINKERLGEFVENRTISNVLYNYKLLNEDKSTQEIAWPNTINYDITKAIFVVADITILFVNIHREIKMTICYMNNRWCFIPNGELLIELKY